MDNGLLIGNAPGFRSDDAVKVVTEQNRRTQDGKQNQKQGGSVYAGDLRGNQDRVSAKFAYAQKNAVKRLLEQFKSDIAIDAEMQAGSKRAEELALGATDAFKELNDLDDQRAELMKQYEIDPNGQEQKDLELMQKANEANKNPFDQSLQLTDEEKERYAKLPQPTEYQEAMLVLDKREEQLRNTIQKNRQDIAVENATVEATKKALLKVHPMVEAKKDSEKMMQNALKEQAYDLLQEGVDKVNEDMAENKEEMAEAKAEALEEKIEREKMKAEEAKEEISRQELQESVFAASEPGTMSDQQLYDNLQNEIKNLIQDQIVLDVDLKGLRVDKQV